MKVGRIVMIVIGAVLALIGFGLLAGGAAALVGYATQRTDGYFQTGEVRLTSATYAIGRTVSTWRASPVGRIGWSTGERSAPCG